MTLPTFSTYGNYSSGNYGAHALCFEIPGKGSFWFSYKTLVAFYHPTRGRIVRQNDWGPTTGKHLNAIDGGNKKGCVTAEEFGKLYREAYPNDAQARVDDLRDLADLLLALHPFEPPGPSRRDYIDHIDGNPRNNDPANLRRVPVRGKP